MFLFYCLFLSLYPSRLVKQHDRWATKGVTTLDASTTVCCMHCYILTRLFSSVPETLLHLPLDSQLSNQSC